MKSVALTLRHLFSGPLQREYQPYELLHLYPPTARQEFSLVSVNGGLVNAHTINGDGGTPSAVCLKRVIQIPGAGPLMQAMRA
jgi:hypothetical protein